MKKTVTGDFENFTNTLVDELIAMPDEQILKDCDPAALQAEGLRLLQAAKALAGRTRLAPTSVTPEEARRFIARIANDDRYTLAARSLGDLSDDEALKLYNKLRSLKGPNTR
ncbi:hypothetical protein RugamoR64_15050 [Duganella rhizosphaerae]|uniref:hypothetical protein n=1 Tax=Duganella rhizosphaerae TaxID=2885763 RepID=UPI0030E7A46D